MHGRWLSLAAVAAAGLLAAAAGGITDAAAPGFHLVGDAHVVGGHLRLTDLDEENFDERSGAAWLTRRVAVTEGFTARFTIRITPARQPGGEDEFIYGDGMAFVVHGDARGVSAIAAGGGSLGYGASTSDPPSPGRAIADSVAVEFDTYANDEESFPGVPDPDSNHVSVQTRGTKGNSPDHRYSLGASSAIPALADGSNVPVLVRYVPGTLSVTVGESDPIVVALDLAKRLRLPDGRAWIGFTAGVGQSTENHDVTSFRYAGPDGRLSSDLVGSLPDTATTSSPRPDASRWLVLVAGALGLVLAVHRFSRLSGFQTPGGEGTST